MMEWKEVRLGDVSYELSDGLHKAPKFDAQGDYIFVNANNLVNGHIEEKDINKRTTYEEYLKYASPLNDTTILYSIDGTIGNIARYRGEKCVLGKGACYINPNTEILNDNFLYYQLQSPHFKSYISLMETGSTIKHISLKTMRNYVFPCPSLSDQRRIASILSSLDKKIETNNKINANLEEMAQTIFKNWFVDFAPFKDGKFVDSELGMIPEGWRVGTLSDICEYSKRKIKVSSLTVETYFSTENMLPNKEGATIASSLPNIDMTTGCMEYDVLISNIRPYFKKIIRVDKPCGCSTDVMCFHPNGSKYYSYMYRILYDDVFFEYIMSGAKGTKMPRGDKKMIMDYQILIPKDSVLEKFSAVTLNIFEKIKLNKQENARLASIRDTLLPRLMSGEIEV